MIKPRVGFIVYGVHKDGLLDPNGTPFIDDKIVDEAKQALQGKGLELVCHDVIVATKAEAKEVLGKFKHDDDIDAIVLFTGTWVWSSHMLSALRDFAKTGKAIVVWTHPGSQGWRPVGGLVLSAAMKEIGLKYRFVYGYSNSEKDVGRIVSYCTAGALVNKINMTTAAAFGGRGMGQNCGVADPSQWTKTFGIDIDSRDTTQLIETARSISEDDVESYRQSLSEWFEELPPKDDMTSRSIRLYLAMKKLMESEGFDFYTIQSFPGLGDDYSATCLMQSMILNDRVATSTLSDFNTLMSVILLNEISTEGIYYGDLQHIDKDTKEIKIIGDGTIPPSLAGMVCGGKAKFAEHGIPTEGKAGGLSVSLVAKKGDGILARLGRADGKFQMVLAKCEIVEPDAYVLEDRKNECGIPFWPHAFLKMDADMDNLIESWNSEYACLGYGDNLVEILTDFCELTDIEAILV